MRFCEVFKVTRGSQAQTPGLMSAQPTWEFPEVRFMTRSIIVSQFLV